MHTLLNCVGVIFDSMCCLDSHVSQLYRRINFNEFIWKDKIYPPTTEKTINAIETSRLDYCKANIEENNPTSTECNAASIMQRGLNLYLKGALWFLCWKYCTGFPGSIRSVTNSSAHLKDAEWPCSARSRSISIKICTTTAPPFGGSISLFTKMVTSPIWKLLES